MHPITLAVCGMLGIFIGFHVLLSVPSLWGYPALAGGLFLMYLGAICYEEDQQAAISDS